MTEIIVRGNLAVRQLVNSGGLYKLQPVGESLASFVNAATFEFGRNAKRPYGETLSGHTGASQNALLYGTQLLELRVYELIQCLRDTRANIFKRHTECPFPISLCNYSLFLHILEDGHHEKRVAAAGLVEQLRNTRCRSRATEL